MDWTGTRKQIEWAKQIKAKMRPLVEEVYLNDFDEITDAEKVIDNRKCWISLLKLCGIIDFETKKKLRRKERKDISEERKKRAEAVKEQIEKKELKDWIYNPQTSADHAANRKLFAEKTW